MYTISCILHEWGPHCVRYVQFMNSDKKSSFAFISLDFLLFSFHFFIWNFHQLMSHVRLPLVSREFLMTCVETEPLIREDQQCKELLLEAMKYHLLPEQRSLMTTQRTLERRPDGMRSYMFAVGKFFHAFCSFYCVMLWYWCWHLIYGWFRFAFVSLSLSVCLPACLTYLLCYRKMFVLIVILLSAFSFTFFLPSECQNTNATVAAAVIITIVVVAVE